MASTAEIEENSELLLTKTPLHNKLKPECKKPPRLRHKITENLSNLDLEYLNTDSSQSNEENIVHLKEPPAKITIIERAVGHFNAENDVENQRNSLNLTTNEGPPFICKICNQWFYMGAKLKLHYITNHFLYHCEICTILFETSDEKTIHISKFHTPIFCEICQNYFDDLSKLLDHYEIDHDSTTCKFCGILLQPKNMINNHIIRKHCVHLKYFESDCKMVENIPSSPAQFFCALCDKNRETEIFFGHLHSHHKLNISSLLNLMKKLSIQIDVYGASKDEIEGERNDELVYKNSCHVCLLRYTKKIPKEFHSVYCQSKLQCKYCEKCFSNVNFLTKHVEKAHIKFLCEQGCQSTAYNTENNLYKHYFKFHEVIPCRYCYNFIEINSLNEHLEQNHKYKAVIMKNFNDTLFEITEKQNKHIVICCLCDENITLLAENIKDIFQHYNLIHSVSFNKILQLIGAKPLLEDYENFYREINESIKKEDGGQTSKSPENELITVLTPKIKIKSEPVDEFEESEEEQMNNETIEDTMSHDDVTDDESKSKRPSADYSHLQDQVESDFDIEESEILVNSDSELEVENTDFICEFCDEKLPKVLDLIVHIYDKHKIKSKYLKYECRYCSETLINYKTHANHLLSHHGNVNFDISRELFKCECDNYQVVHSLARKHILEVHKNNLDKYDLNTIGLKCKFCEMRFWERLELNEHEINYHYQYNSDDFQKCPKCFSVFSSQKCLATHSNQSHTDIPPFSNLVYKCLNCSTCYPKLSTLRDHFRMDHPMNRSYRCPVPHCFKVCKKKKYMQCHLTRPHEKEKEIELQEAFCHICKKKFKSYKAATIHKLMKHQKDRAGFQCRICNERFATSEQRKLHYTTAHPGQLAYNCLECGKGFVSKSGLYGHKKLHQENSNMICPYCSKEFSRRDSYNEHLLIHIGPRHQCPHCPKSFTQRSNLTRHVRIHTGAKPYQCTYCDKRFSDRGACRSHERVHTKEEHCECTYCGKKFTKKQKLKYHLRFHTGEGLLTCETCGKQFSNTYSLNEHRRIHNNDTLMMCSCGRGFATEKYLKRHMETVHNQTMIKYICPICFKTLFQKSSYNQHIMTHSAVKHVRCLLCKKEYNTKKTVKRHLQEEHKLRGSAEIYKHMYQLTPEEAGLNLPPASEMAIKVVNEQNLINLDVAKMQETFASTAPPEVVVGNKLSAAIPAEIQIKAEPVSDLSDFEFQLSESDSEDEIPLSSRRKKGKKGKKKKK